jgi:hypothetical protein
VAYYVSLVLIFAIRFQLLLVNSVLVVQFYVKFSSEYWTSVQSVEEGGSIRIREAHKKVRILRLRIRKFQMRMHFLRTKLVKATGTYQAMFRIQANLLRTGIRPYFVKVCCWDCLGSTNHTRLFPVKFSLFTQLYHCFYEVTQIFF